MNSDTITNIYSMEDVGSLTNYIKVMTSLSVAKDSQTPLCGVVPVVVADPHPPAVRKLQSDFARVVEGTTDARFLAAAMACVRGTLAGPIILNTSNAPWVNLLVGLGDVAGEQQKANSVVEWKGALGNSRKRWG